MMDDRQTALRAIPLIDLTDLSDDCTREQIDTLVARALALPIPVAALCIWPRFVAQARAGLGKSRIKLATVVNFPHGGEDVVAVCAQTRAALADGADEIDLVLPWRAMLAGHEDIAREMVRAVAHALTPAAKLKVIIESGELPDDETIARASRIAIEEGADFVKTSTGKTKISATPGAARIMLGAIRDSGKLVGFKASGGLRTLSQARTYLDLADEIMGADFASPAHFRFGASSLLDPLLAAL
ncbi:MAG: deoxyribose-phosphate aldolase [Hyphomicrobiales bacterium]|jgi:deoxyribose-phosphate aldolase|nr:deoxyribose-phosphate aldolase [Hyphomicrobiales bacterium]